MSNPVEQFESILKEIPSLKAPGVSGSRIKKLRDLFINNVADESKLVQKVYETCKATPAQNKLGTVYVVDAIVRGLRDELDGGNDSEISESSPEGTPQSAIFKFQSLIETIMDDAIPVSSDDVKEKISKLVDIWSKTESFSKSTIESIKAKHFKTNTPPGTPPKKKVSFATESNSSSTNNNTTTTTDASSSNSSSTSAKDPSSVLQNLANLARQSPAPPAVRNAGNSFSPPVSNQNVVAPTNSAAPPVAASSDPNAIFQLLQSMNKINGAQQNYQQQSQFGMQQQQQPGSSIQQGQPLPSQESRYRERDGGRDRDRGFNPLSRRQRSRSPRRRHEESHTPNVDAERNIPGTPHYREKNPYIDPTIPSECIKVGSRTIFIGGVPHSMDERGLVQQLRPYAEVQSVIINNERKHAFVKVYSRPEAEQVIQAFSVSHHPSGLRARWGVGFGPRDCCDYQSGVSTIPLNRLTEADKKWIVSAEWGGTGGMPLQGGLFIEEPDIEVGAGGVSSKSISKKMPTNSTHNGPKSDGLPITGHGRHNNQYQQHLTPPTPYGQPAANPGNIPMNFGQPIPQGPPPPVMGAPPMDQAQLMATMMAAMQQNMQQAPQQGGQQPDMNAMFQNLANMMRQNQQPQ
ncbi:hypothetical protein CANARDRAFT_30354 [[Candida] arabinofermentans NRRL YB-2248]|uniref:CID domain-containing protein n=1 Tax=[Candida] arabinofermentans NRRL YB-2248 TaxID=983967 RepID=A0A1E4SU90_9ASCO|nr:hypothetical protein CANARDRAFT_30354 [[Candida] arabinofermentans NRRL YB-2248]